MDIDPNIKIPGVTRPGRQLIDAPDRLESVYLEWLENGAPKGLPSPGTDGFVSWAGSTIPVQPRTKVAVKLGGGFTLKDGSYLAGSAFRFDWSHTGAADDIVAFKLMEF